MSKTTKADLAVQQPDKEISYRQIGIGLVFSLLLRLGVTGEHASNIAAIAAPAILWGLDQLAFRLKLKARSI